MKPQPMQPIVWDGKGVIRFQRNEIVCAVLDAATNGQRLDLDDLARMPFRREDREQFAMLIGYSVAGFTGLGYSRPSTRRKSVRIAGRVMKTRERR